MRKWFTGKDLQVGGGHEWSGLANVPRSKTYTWWKLRTDWCEKGSAPPRKRWTRRKTFEALHWMLVIYVVVGRCVVLTKCNDIYFKVHRLSPDSSSPRNEPIIEGETQWAEHWSDWTLQSHDHNAWTNKQSQLAATWTFEPPSMPVSSAVQVIPWTTFGW